MNPGMNVSYKGELRNEATHLRSGNKLMTDAPIDNNGRGEAFSPTDLLCTSLATCMITLMGIAGASKGIQIGSIEADIEKIMATDPRRVIRIVIQFKVENLSYSEREKTILENAAHTCPVAKSLHPEIVQEINFNYI